MRRFVLALAVLCAALVVGSSTHAAPGSASRAHYLAGLVKAHNPFRTWRALRPLRDVPLGEVRAPTRQDPGLLALAASAFSPATLVPQEVGIEANTVADAGPFRPDHSTTYTSLGRVTGFFQRADWTPSGQMDTATFRYQASVFPSAALAQAAWQDGVTHSQTLTSLPASNCTSQPQVTCTYLGLQTTTGNAVAYFVLQYNQCLEETSAEFSVALFNAQQTQLAQTIGTITVAGVAAMQAACATTPATSTTPQPGVSATPPPSIDFTVVAITVRKSGKIDDPSKPSAKQFKRGKKAYLYIYYTVRSAPANVQIADTFTVARNGAIIGIRTFQHALLAPPPNNYFDVVGFKLPKAGKYVFTGRLTISGQAEEGKVNFKVVK